MAIKVEVELSDNDIKKIAKEVANINEQKEFEIGENGEKYYTIAQAAEKFNLNKRTLQDHVSKGLVIANKPGGSRTFKISESNLNKYLNNE